MRAKSLRRLVAPLAAVAALALFAPDAAAIGLLVPTQPGIPALKLVNHRVEVDITERGARTKVTQEFENPTGRQLEATYLFPMPKGASVDEFALWMNGKRETGKVMERKEARRIYESIVRRARDPGLIEYVDSELFQARVFPIPPNGRQKVELIYSHLVPYEDGVHRYEYPMKTDEAATTTLDDFTLTVRIKSKVDIKNIYSPSHRVATQRKGKKAAASFEKHAFSLSDDFRLYWSVDDKDVGLTLLSYKDDMDKAGYFMLLASPRDGFRSKEIIGKRLSLVVDTSGSMAGAKMDAVKGALDYILSRLGEDDLFNVITFGGFVETFADKMQSANRSNKAKARKFVKQIEPLGGTNIDEALQTALKGATGSRRAPHMVVFLTDGRPTVGETEVQKIISRAAGANGADARVFVFGVGEDVNTILLDKLASDNGGSSTYLEGDATVEADLKSFYDRVSHPVLSDLKLDVSGVRVFGNHPRKLPDLFKGGQLVLLGRYREGGKATVKLSGAGPKGRQSFSYKADFSKEATEHKFIPRLWAQRQVGALLAEIREKGESKGLVDEVTQLATAFGIVTPYTSYLVLEPNAQIPPQPRPGPRPRPMPRPRRDAVFGGGGAADDMGAFAPMEEAEMDAAPAPAAAAPRTGKGGTRMRIAKPKKSAKSREMLRKSEGSEAVRAAREIGRLKDSTVANERKVRTSVARALGRKFTFQAGYFVDERSKAKDKTLEVKAFSDAFFDVLRERPDLKEALMLGEAVKISVAKGRTLVITPDGAEKVKASQLKAFLKKK
jgi:Ca-activated chloride channel family protein